MLSQRSSTQCDTGVPRLMNWLLATSPTTRCAAAEHLSKTGTVDKEGTRVSCKGSAFHEQILPAPSLERGTEVPAQLQSRMVVVKEAIFNGGS